MLFLNSFKRKPDQLSDVLPWVYLATSGIIYNKDGSFQRTIEVRGKDMDSMTDFNLVSYSAKLNNALMRFGSGWAIFCESKRLKSKGYPDSIFPDPVSELIDIERGEKFKVEGYREHYESRVYITFVYKTPIETVAKARRYLYENINTSDQDYSIYLENFETETERIINLLEDIFPYVKILTNDQLLTYLHSTISTKKHRVKMPEVPMFLDALLPDQPLKPGVEPKLGDYFLKTITIRFYPSETCPGLLEELNSLAFEYRWVTRFIYLDETEAKREIEKLRKKWFAKRTPLWSVIKKVIANDQDALEDSFALKMVDDSDDALDDLSNRDSAFGKLTTTITVWDKDPKQAIDKIKEVERVVNGLRFVTIREDLNAVEAWLSSIPGQVYANVRLPVLSTKNLSRLIPAYNVWAGPEAVKHLNAPPLLYGTSRGNTPFRFSNYIQDVGHMVLLGPTGSGKSAFLNLIKAQWLRYENAQVIAFDKQESSLALTYGVKGAHSDIGSGNLHFQPLRDIHKPAEKVWAIEWLCNLISNENIEITSKIRNDVSDTLENLKDLPQKQRTITSYRNLMQNASIRDALQLYTIEGDYGYIIDADEDNLQISKWQNFEIGNFLSMKHLVPIVFDYIFHRLEERFTGAPTLLVFDEAWEYLGNKIFLDKLEEWLLSARKNNVSVVFCSAGLAKITENPITPILLESCPTRIYLPNAQANDPNVRSIYERLGLNEVQIATIEKAEAKKEYYYSSPLGNRLFTVSLDRASLAFCGSSSKADRKLIHDLLKEKGSEVFPVEFLAAKGLPEHADILKEVYQRMEGE
jgi:type IV secretion system protein VirB4